MKNLFVGSVPKYRFRHIWLQCCRAEGEKSSQLWSYCELFKSRRRRITDIMGQRRYLGTDPCRNFD